MTNQSMMSYLGFNPSLVESFAELCNKALTEAGFNNMECDDVDDRIYELVHTSLRDGMGYSSDFEPCDIIIDAIAQETCNALQEQFPEEEFSYNVDGVYSELYINGAVYNGEEHLNSFLQNYCDGQQLFENFTVLSKSAVDREKNVSFAIGLSSNDLELALLRGGATAADARDTVCRFKNTHNNPHCPEMVTVIVSRTSDNITMRITDWTKCNWEGRNWSWDGYPDNPDKYSVPLTKEEKARFEDTMQQVEKEEKTIRHLGTFEKE